MKVIFGIGNPGSRYAKTRHNIGFMSLDFFSSKHDLHFIHSKGEYFFATDETNSFMLVKPSTYVNNSGSAVSQLMTENNIPPEKFLVVVDDVNIPLGEIRVRLSGGDGGHNGIHSIIYSIQSDKFPRIRLGVGNQFPEGRMAEYVLSEFQGEEKTQLENVLNRTNQLIEKFISGGAKDMLDENSRLNQLNQSSGQIKENTIRRD